MISGVNEEILLRDRLEMLIPPLPWDRPRIHRGDGPWVLLLHGLWRGQRAMEPMSRWLQHAGYSTINLPYPSTRKPIPQLAELIAKRVHQHIGDQPFHAVTHSLGGIVARCALDRSLWNLRRLVMIAPPSQGSHIVDYLQRQHPCLHFCLGPAGRQLGTQGLPKQLPGLPDHIEAAAIMGERDSIGCFDGLFDSSHDGIVPTNGGQLAGLKRFALVDADHTFISAHPRTKQLCLQFIQTGDWDD